MFSVSQIHPFSSTPTTTSSKTKTKFGSEEAFTFLQNCTSFRQLKQIHAKIIRSGLSHDQLLLRKMLQFSSTSGNMDYAALVFRHQIPSPLTFTWNLMIRAYTLNASPRQALLLFTLMTSRGFPPDKFTFPFVIKACTASSALRPGDAVHGLAIKAGFSADIFVQNTLMDFYFKCGDAHSGRKVFDKMRVRNLVSWTTMVTGLVGSGDLRAARAIFEQMPAKNVVSWTIMIDGYVVDRQPEEALKLFRRMQLDNVSPNEFTLVSLLKACTELGSLKLGRWVHDFALKNGFELDVFFGTALIDTYSKCGSLEDARRVFDKMQSKSLATWNSMITSLGVHGFGEEALALFAEMERRNVRPDEITFVGILSACLQKNSVSDCRKYFEYMNKRYGISPIKEHYICMIELYSRAGMLDEVVRLVNVMPVKPDEEQVWGGQLCQWYYSVFNFVTKQDFAPPQPQIRGPSIRTGLAVDGQHYQIVRIFGVNNNGGSLLELEIYSSQKGVWRLERPLINLPPDLPKLNTAPLFSNGAIHWELGGHLLVYCIRHGECKLIQLPNHVDLDKWSPHCLTYGQCLWESEGRVHFCYSDFEGIHTWFLLKDLEVHDYCSYHYNLRWKHAHTILHQTLVAQISPRFWHSGLSFASPVAYVENTCTMYLRLPGVVVSYNLRTQTLKEICRYAFPKSNFHCCLIVPVVCSSDALDFRASKGGWEVPSLPTAVAKDMAERGLSSCGGLGY